MSQFTYSSQVRGISSVLALIFYQSNGNNKSIHLIEFLKESRELILTVTMSSTQLALNK